MDNYGRVGLTVFKKIILRTFMLKYKVLGTEGEEVEVGGNKYAVGSEIDLSHDVATPALSEGKIELVPHAESNKEAVE